jgi:D-glycero-D-manno-heptose 1,7-bisphosphate phosphatase
MINEKKALIPEKATFARPAVLLDRDGVLNVDVGYVYRPEDLKLTRTAAKAVRLLNDAGYVALVVTNQSGVARGMFSCAEVEQFHEAMQSALAAAGAKIDGFYYCPYHPEGRVARFACDHPDRKPRPGMLLKAIDEWSLDRSRTVLIGDKQSDMDAAAAAGVQGILVPCNVPDLAAVVEAALA